MLSIFNEIHVIFPILFVFLIEQSKIRKRPRVTGCRAKRRQQCSSLIMASKLVLWIRLIQHPPFSFCFSTHCFPHFVSLSFSAAFLINYSLTVIANPIFCTPLYIDNYRSLKVPPLTLQRICNQQVLL